MKQIIKLRPPNSFVQHKANPPATYEGLTNNVKEELRNNLLKEQGFICCYCMKRIPESTSPYSKIEHHKCQERNKHLELDYSNLFIACTGNEGSRKMLQTCDTKKGNLDISIHPCSNNPNCNTLFKYTLDGRIKCADEQIQNDIDTKLNLNCQTLKDLRAEVYNIVSTTIEAESKRLGKKNLKLKYFQNQLKEWETPDANGKLKPFCMVAVYYLNKKIIQNQ